MNGNHHKKGQADVKAKVSPVFSHGVGVFADITSVWLGK